MLDTKRHNDVFLAESFRYPVTIIGCGGMGSRIAEALIRMGLGAKGKSPIKLYDHDSFAKHNLCNQWVYNSGLKKNKVAVVKSQMLAINPTAVVHGHVRKVEERITLSGVVFLCLDSMAARRKIIDNLLAGRKKVSCVIETRMDARIGISHCFNPNNQKQLACWKLYWHSDAEADNMQGCGGNQSIISAIFGTSMMALRQFEMFARDRSTRDMPNRMYHNFDEGYTRSERWPSA